MDWNSLLALLSGGGLVTLINWFVGFKTQKRKSALDKDDISRMMAERDNETILKLYEDKRDILEKLSQLEAMLYKLVACKHFDDCPARCQLQNYKQTYYSRAMRGQSAMGEKSARRARDSTVVTGDSDGPDGQPP